MFIYFEVLVKAMATKSIENLDDLVWRTFVAHCKIKDVLIGEELTKILQREVDGK